MGNIRTLQEVVTEIARKGRISFGDVQRLQRDILPEGLASREEAGLLIGLDASASRRDPAWGRFLTSVIVDFVVWGERPTGTVDEETAVWLAGALLSRGIATPTARLIAREIAQEAQAFENDALVALSRVGRTVRAGRKSQPARTEAPASIAA